MRKCKCGEALIPRKKWFKNIIIHKCPKSNIFNSKDHSVSKEYFMKAEKFNLLTTK